MKITDVRIKLAGGRGPGGKLKAFCTITLDQEFVVRDLKIIEGSKGLFVAMPSRKRTERCPNCRAKNPLGARFCNACGRRLPLPPEGEGEEARSYADIAHPIHAAARAKLQAVVLRAYRQAAARGHRQAGGAPRPEPRVRLPRPEREADGSGDPRADSAACPG